MSQAKQLLQSFIAHMEWENELEIEQHATGVRYSSAIRIADERCDFRLDADDNNNRMAMYVCLPIPCLEGQTNQVLRLFNRLNSSIPFGCVTLAELGGPTIFRTAMELTGSVAAVDALVDLFESTVRVMVCWIPPIKAVCTTVTTADQAYQDACNTECYLH
jgi:hypothetical protein